jgi:hypothetical protein
MPTGGSNDQKVRDIDTLGCGVIVAALTLGRKPTSDVCDSERKKEGRL